MNGGVPILGQPRPPANEAEMRMVQKAQEEQALVQTYRQMVCNLTATFAIEWFKRQVEHYGANDFAPCVVDSKMAESFAQSADNIANAALERAFYDRSADQVP